MYIVPENCVFYVEVLLWSMTAIARFHFIAFELKLIAQFWMKQTIEQWCICVIYPFIFEISRMRSVYQSSCFFKTLPQRRSNPKICLFWNKRVLSIGCLFKKSKHNPASYRKKLTFISKPSWCVSWSERGSDLISGFELNNHVFSVK